MSSTARLVLVCLAPPLLLWIALECWHRRGDREPSPEAAPAPAIVLNGLPGPDARAVLEDANFVLERHRLKIASTRRLASVRDVPASFRGVVAECAARANIEPELCRIELSGKPSDLRNAVIELGSRANAIVLGTEFELGGDFQTLSAKLWLWI